MPHSSLRRQMARTGLTLALLSSALAVGAQPAGKLRPPHTDHHRGEKRFFAPANTGGRPLQNAPDAGARDLLRQMLQAERTLLLSGNQITTITRDGRDITSEQRVVRNGSHAFRLEYVRPPRLAGEQIVDNGRFFWHYIPARNTLEFSPTSRINRQRQRIPEVMEQIQRGDLQVKVQGQDTVAGHACTIIEVAPTGLSRAPRRRFWIDPTNGAQLRIDQLDAAGKRVSSSYYTAVTYNPTLDKEAFRPPKTPKDTQFVTPQIGTPAHSVAEAQTQAGFPVLQPSFLPTGFRFQSAFVSDYRGKKLVALRYVNGLNVLSLFETPLPPNSRPDAPAGKINHARHGVLVTVQDGLRLILVGNLSPEDMQQVMSSVR